VFQSKYFSSELNATDISNQFDRIDGTRMKPPGSDIVDVADIETELQFNLRIALNAGQN
jgi:hypothetical protein